MRRGGLKGAAPTRGIRSLRPNPQEAAAAPLAPPKFGSARRRRRRASVSIVNWDEHGAGSLRASQERSRHGGDSSRWAVALPAFRVCTSDSCRSSLSERAARGAIAVRRALCTSALQRMGWGAKWPGTLAQRPTRAVGCGTEKANLKADQRATTRRRSLLLFLCLLTNSQARGAVGVLHVHVHVT